MNRSFPALAGSTPARYPLMAPQDFGKLAYQSEFGPGHMVSDPALALERLLTECRGLPPDCLHRPPEPIGGGLCRFHLEPAHLSQEGLLPLVSLLFTATACRHTAPGRVWRRGWSPSSPWTSPDIPPGCGTTGPKTARPSTTARHSAAPTTPTIGCWSGIM